MERLRATTGIAQHSKEFWTRCSSVCLCILAFVALSSFPASAQAPNNESRTQVSLATPRPEPSGIPDPERILLEKQKLRIENENNKRDLSTRSILNLIYGNLPVLLALTLALGGLIKYFQEQKTTRGKREEERFENVVKSLGSEHEQERISAAVLLPTFLTTGYNRFHEQVFNLAAGHLRMGAADNAGSPTMKVELPSTMRRFELRLDKDLILDESEPSEDSADTPVSDERRNHGYRIR